MPIYRVENKLIYFAHIPKSGGTSIEKFLKHYATAVAFLNGRYLPRTRYPWIQTSPQHADAEAIGALFDTTFFDVSFALIRHPATRFLSAFNHHRNRHNIPFYTRPINFLNRIINFTANDHYRFDNHFRPMCDMIPENAHVFHIEEGLDDVIDFLTSALNTRLDKHLLTTSNRGNYTPYRPGLFGTIKETLQAPATSLTDELCETTRRIYSDDFSNFPYPTRPINEPAQ